MQEDFFVSPITFAGSNHLLISPSFMMSTEVTSTILRNSVNAYVYKKTVNPGSLYNTCLPPVFMNL